MVSALAGQNRFALRFWQMGQVNCWLLDQGELRRL